MDGSVLLVMFRGTIVDEARIGRSDSRNVEGENIMMEMYARLTGTWETKKINQNASGDIDI